MENLAGARARSARRGLIAVCAAWGLFWGAWSGLLPAVQDRVGVSAGSLGLLLTFIAVGAIPAMALTGRLARGREPAALTMVTVLFGAAIAALAGASSPALLGLCLVAVGMASGAFDVCLSMAIARAERATGARLFQPVHAAFPVMVVVAAPLAGLARQVGVALPAILLAVAVLVAGSGLSVPAALRSTGAGETADGPRPPTVRRRHLLRAGIGVGALAACMLIVENVGSPLLVAGLSAAATLPTAVVCLGLLALPLLTASLVGQFPTAERAPA